MTALARPRGLVAALSRLACPRGLVAALPRLACPRPLAAVLLALACLPGCANTGPQDISGWAEARGADFMDIFGVRVALGPGLGAYVRVTEALELGYLSMGQAELSLPAPKGVSLRGFPAVVFGLRGRYGGLWYESSQELMLPGFSSRDYEVSTVRDRPIQRENIAGYVTPHGEYDNWRYEFGLGAHLLVAGAQAEVRPLELLDFLAGVLGFDPGGDDAPGAFDLDSDGEPEAP
jgi:hypothetical protein